MTDVQAWKKPATREQIEHAVSYVLVICEPDVAEDRASLLTRVIYERDYTAAEVALIKQELPYDQVLTDKLGYGRHILPGDFERIVKRSRDMRAQLRSKVTVKQREKLLAAHPSLDRDCFKQCAFDEYKNPLFIYVPEDA